MAKPGRISAAQLSIVTGGSQQRPPAPEYLFDTEKLEWRALTGTVPADWFPRESHAALAALCRYTCRSRVLGARISKIEEKALATEEGVRVLDKLCAMLERETRCVEALSRSMRLTQRTRLDKRVAGSRAQGVHASANEDGSFWRCSKMTNEEALEHCIAMVLASNDKVRVQQIRDFLDGDGPYLPPRPRDEVGRFCSYHLQSLALI